MANIYMKADQAVYDLALQIINQWYPELAKVKLQLGILFALSARESQAAVTENGHPVDGTVKIVPLRDRVTKGFDVELIIDADEWRNGKREHHESLLDELLARLQVKKPKKRKQKRARGSDGAVHGTDQERTDHEEAEFLTDDIGRPILVKRKGDWYAGIGFQAVIERRGGYAPSARLLEKANAIVETATKVYDTLEATTPIIEMPQNGQLTSHS